MKGQNARKARSLAAVGWFVGRQNRGWNRHLKHSVLYCKYPSSQELIRFMPETIRSQDKTRPISIA